MSSSDMPLIAVAGASGFVGTHLQMHLSKHYRFRALTRSPNIVERHIGEQTTEWCYCDIYSLPKLTDALKGCDYGIYLVHSMAPSSRLMQGKFEDTDLLLADNFIRAAEAAKLEHVIYLSGLLPEEDEDLSPHLRSRAEVEMVLRHRSVPVTVLRAGLIFGPGGSSFSMLVNLVRRLPIMLLPAWAKSTTQSVDIENVCEAFEYCLKEPKWRGGTYDLASHRPMTYASMIQETGRLLGFRLISIHLPFNFFSISKRCIAYLGDVPVALVEPLQESLRHNLRARPNPLLDQLRPGLIPLKQSLERAVDDKGCPLPNPRSFTQKADKKQIKKDRRVRSVQRMPLPKGWSAREVMNAYGIWLDKTFRKLLSVCTDKDGVVRFNLVRQHFTLLELTPTPFSDDGYRCAFYITGGCLSRKVDPPGRLEFRIFPERGCIIASIHGFSPTLPWWLYARTQAWVHLIVMHCFGRYLKKVDTSGHK
jgi:uncharacterized protein YbjT (DUF2867 family)